MSVFDELNNTGNTAFNQLQNPSDSALSFPGNGFPQFPMPFGFTELNTGQLANKYYNNRALFKTSKLEVYADEESTALFDNGDPVTELEEVIAYDNQVYKEYKDFDLRLFTSTDGVRLLQQYKEVKVYSNEIVLFLEIDDKTNFFGSVMRVKVGSDLVNKKGLPFADLIASVQEAGINVKPRKIKKLLNRKIYKSKDSLLKWFFSSLSDILGELTDVVTSGLGDLLYETIPKAIYEIRIKDESWNPTVKGFNALLIPDDFEAYIAKKLEGDNGENSILKEIVNPFFKRVSALEKDAINRLEGVKAFLPNKAYRKFKVALKYLFKKVSDIEKLVYNAEYGFFKLIITSLEAANAFLCGLYNSIIDTVIGVFQIVGLVFKGLNEVNDFTQNIGYYTSLAFELVENIIDDILEIDYVELFKQLFFVPLKLAAKIISFVATQTALTIQEVYYYIGYIVGFIVETVISILFSGGTLTVSKVLTKTFKEPVQALLGAFKGAVHASKTLINKVINAIRYIFKQLKKPKQLIDDFLKFIDDLFGAGKRKFDDLIRGRTKHRLDWMASNFFRFGDDGETVRNAIKLKLRPDDGWYHVLAHGDKKGRHFIVNGIKYKPEDFAQLILERGYQKGDPIRLVVCHSGAKPNGIAAKLAKILDTTIEAPTNKVALNEAKEFVIDKKGKFVTFKP